MKFRDLVLPSGECFQVPQYLYRIDRGSTHGWQLRYEGSQLFSDHVSPCKGPQDSLERALRELEARMSRFAKPTLLKTNNASHKRLDCDKLAPSLRSMVRPCCDENRWG